MKNYLIECLDKNGRWFIVGTDITEGWAKRYADDYAKLTDAPVRVRRQSIKLDDCDDGEWGFHPVSLIGAESL